MSERKNVKREVDYADFEYMTLAGAKSQIDDWLSRYGEKAFFEWEDDRYSEGRTLKLYVNSPETDEEMARRIKEEEDWAARRLENDRKTYEQLKKRFDVC